MKRRDLLKGMAVLPFAGLFYKPSPGVCWKEMYPDQLDRLGKDYPVIDYAATKGDYLGQRDEFGYIFRRTLVHADVPDIWVKGASLLSDGSLLVEVYQVSTTMNIVSEVYWDQTEFKRKYMVYSITHDPVLGLGKEKWTTLVGILPPGSWKLNQWDGCGKLTHTLKAEQGRLVNV